MKKQIPAWMVLGIIMLVAAFSLAGTNLITKGIIEKQAILDAENARKAVLASAEVFDQVELEEGAPLTGLYVGKQGETEEGYVGSITVQGYGGPIEIIAGVLSDGTISGINVGGSAFAETAGLGSKAKDAAFMQQFAGKQTPVKVVVEGQPKDNTTVDAITAATITTKAVARGVNDIAKFVDGHLNPIGDLTAGFTAGTAAASADGFAGPVAVEVTFDGEATIEAIKIGDDNFSETVGYGAAALEPAFAEQFVGKSPLAIGDIDAISGATVTSVAVVDAINKAMQQLAAPTPQFTAGTATASADGFAGPVAVEVTFQEEAIIEAIKIGDDNFAETQGYGAAALEPAFAQQFVGKKAPLKLEDIEAISGATVTSSAVIDAVNAAYKQQLSSDEAETEPAPAPAEVSEVPAEVEGAVTVSKEGFAGPVAVTVSFEEDGATIKTLAIGDENFAETPGFGLAAKEPDFINQFIGKKAPLKVEDIEAISGATITTEAVLDAINEAQGGAQEEEKPAEEAVEVPAEVEGAVTVSKEGFAGPVAVTVSFEEDGATIKTLAIGDENFAETPGFGLAAKEPEFINQFIGKKAPLKVEDIEAISGATITTEAVLDAINEAQGGAQEEEKPAEEAVVEVPAEVEGAVTVSKEGFAGPVAVTVSFEEDGATIKTLAIGDENFAETPGFGLAAKEPDFINQFIGKKAPLKVEDIEAISGATITTEAVLDAINEAQGGAKEEDKPSEEAAEVPAEVEGAVTVSKEGFAGPVAVTVSFEEDGATIKTLTIGDENFAETPGFGLAAKEPEFINQFIGKKAPLKVEDIEAISGATITTEAVLDAINEAQGGAQEEDKPSEEAAEVPAEVEGAVTVSKEGFAGPVAVTVSFEEDGATIKTLAIGDENFAETPGFGEAAKEPLFINQFIGKKAPLKVEDIEAISGATITTEAVLDAINEAQGGAQEEEKPAEEAVEVPAEVEGAVTVSKEGFAGPVAVTVSFEEDGATIKTLTIGDENFAETPGFGLAAKEPEFINQFIGKKAPLKVEDIEAISGATITTEAVLDAINEAQGGDKEEEKPAEEEAVEAPAEVEGAVTVSKEGFAGPVAVTVSFEEDGATIKTLAIGDENFAETPGFGLAAKEPEFINQFIGKKAPLKVEDIEAISGATITTEAVLDAINEAQGGDKEEEKPAEEEAVEAPAEVEGAVTVSKEGFAGPVAVTVSFEEDGATIKTLAIGDENFAETPGFGEAAKEPEFINQFIGKKAPLKVEDIEAISGATITTEAVLDAINEAQGGAKEEEKPAEEAAVEEPTEVESAVTVSKEGFAGPVAVTVSFEEDGATIKTLAIGDDNFAETPGFGEAAKEPDFINQFIGKQAPLKVEDIEAISGATITTEAVLDAINEAQGQAGEVKPLEAVSEAGERSATAEGFAGPLTVNVSFAADGTIEKLDVLTDTFKDGKSFGAAVLKDSFLQQFIGKKAPMKIEDIDAATFATVTSQAVIDAVNAAFEGK